MGLRWRALLVATVLREGGPVPLVRLDDALDDRKADDVFGEEIHKTDPFGVMQHFDSFAQAGTDVAAEVDLGGVAGDDAASAFA